MNSTKPEKPEQFYYIAAWAAFAGKNQAYVRANQKKALAETAPADACYFSPTMNRWVRANDIQLFEARAFVDRHVFDAVLTSGKPKLKPNKAKPRKKR